MLLSEGIPAEVSLYPSDTLNLQGWYHCHGQLLSTNQFQVMFSLLGTAFGGDGIETFGLPKIDASENMRWMIDMEAPLATQSGGGLSAFDHGIVGEVIAFAGQIRTRPKWLKCNGQALSTTNYANLFKVIGYSFGGSDGTFHAPNLTDPATNVPYLICASGTMPDLAAGTGLSNMPGTLGDIEFLANAEDWSPSDYWHLCDGSKLKVMDNPALFSLIGTTFGGDGTTDFALPTLANLNDHVYSIICISGVYPQMDN